MFTHLAMVCNEDHNNLRYISKNLRFHAKNVIQSSFSAIDKLNLTFVLRDYITDFIELNAKKRR